ncbi:MAG: HAD family hydrolase [Lachnospiraceae bacterium]|nr:HAD family hydrolase [Lachnospiraceae bacterium]
MLKNHYRAIMFDLDGTLLPMDMEEFTSGYFKELYKKVDMTDIPIQSFVDAIWKGTYSMMKNDGTKINRDAFWDTFGTVIDCDTDEMDKRCLDFYSNEFINSKCFTQDNAYAVKAVKTARQKADLVILATNPIFPMAGQITRLGWIDLKKEDFDLVTCYEEESFCKPNPKYFEAVLKKMGLTPKECLMIGNDEKEDMLCAKMAGIDAYLVEDTMIRCKDHPWEGERGSFADMIKMLEGLDR